MKQYLNEIKRIQQLAGINEGALMDSYEFEVTGIIKIGAAFGAASEEEALEIATQQLEGVLDQINIKPL